MAYDDNITNLYNAIKDDYEVGTEDDFRESLRSADNRHTLYEALSGEYELGTEDDFNNSLGTGVNGKDVSHGNDDGFSQVPSQPTQSEESVPKLSAEDVQFLPSGGFGAASVLSPQTGESARNPTPNPSVEGNEAAMAPQHSGQGENYGNDGMNALDEQFAQYVQDGDRSRTPYDKMVVDLLGSGAAETPNDAVNMAYNLTSRYADRTSRQLAGEVISGMDADKSDMGASINEAWYRRDVQDAIVQRARELGLSYQAYVRDHVKPAVQKELSRRYGYSDETAKTWANWIYQDYDAAQNQMHQQEAMQMVQPYVQSFVDEAFGKVDAEARDMWQGLDGGGMPGYTASGMSQQIGTQVLGLMRESAITDPQRVWDELLEHNIKTMVMKMSGDQQFWDSLTSKAEEEGMDAARYAEYRIAPVIEAMVYDQWLKTGVAREMPENVVEYVMGKMKESLPGMVINSMMNSKTRRRMQQEAMARTETGTGKYQPGFTARVAGGTAAMAPDIMLGVFKAGSLLTRGGATAMARSLLGKETFDTLGERMVAHGLAGSAMFGAVDAAKGATEAALDGGSMSDIFSRAWERAKGGMLMGASMVGGPLGQVVANGGNAMRVAAGALTGITLDATAATALGAGEELFANGEIDASKLPESFVENWLTFGLLQGKEQGKNLYGAVRGERTWNGVKFNASEVRQIEGDEAFGEFRKVLKSLEKENKKGYIEELLKSTSKADTPKSRIRDLSPEQKQVVKDAAAEAYESVVYNPDILSSTKAKLSQAMQLPLPAEVYGEAEYFDPIYVEDGHYVLMSRNRYGQAVGEMRFRSEEDAATMRDKVEQEWMSQAEYMSGAMERSAAAARVYANLDDRVNDEYLGEGGVSARLQRKQQLEAKAQLHERDKKAPALTKAEKEELESLAPTEHEQNLNWIFANNRAYKDAMAKQERGEQLTDAEQQIVDAMNEHVISVANDYIDAEQQLLRSEFGVDGTDVDSLRDYAEWLRDDIRESAEVMKEEESPSPALPEGEGENDAQEMPIMPENDGKNESHTLSLPDGEGERPDVASRYDKVVGDDGVVREVTLANGQKVYLVRQRTHDGAGNVIDSLDEMNNEAGAFTAYDINGNVGRFRKDAIASTREFTPEEEAKKNNASNESSESDSNVLNDGAGGEDHQGNRLNSDGSLYFEEVKSVDDITDADFEKPTRSISLPNVPGVIRNAIGAGDKPIIIKKNIFEKNLLDHSDLTPGQSREILYNALYNTSLYGQNKPSGKPYNWIVVSTNGADGKNSLVLLEVNQNKDNTEIVHWHYIRNAALETLKRQAGREGGHILILPSKEEAGGLSSRTSDLSLEGKDTNNSVNPQEKSKKSVAVAIKKVVNKAVGRTYETVAGDGHRVELELQGYDKDGNVKVRRTDYQANGDKVMTMDVMDIERVAQALTEKAMKPVKTVDDKLRESMGKTVYMKRLIDVLTGDEKQQLWDMYESASRRGDAGRQELQEMIDELREAHFEDYVERQRAYRQSEVEAAMTARPKERLNRLRKAFYGYEKAMLYLDDAMMEPQTIEEYAANYLGGVPAPGRGFIEHDSLVAETGHGRRRIGSDSRGYGPYLSAKGEGRSINEIAHGMWEELPEHLKEQWSDQDCKNALLEVLTSAERPSDIANYILKARAESAEEAARHEEDMLIAEHGGTANKFSLKRNQLYEAYETEQGTVDTRGGLVGNATAERVLSPGWRGALHALGRNIGARIEVLTKDEVEQRWPGQSDNARGVTVGDTIYLNEKFVSDNENLRQFVMGHEMTHTIKRENDAKVWKAYVEAVKAAMGDAFAEEFNETRAIYDKRYKEMNRPLLSDEAIEEEVCCDWAGAHMLTDEKAVHAILDSAEKAGADPVALSKQILDWIKDTLRSLHQGYRNGTVGADEVEVMENARRLWQDMYDVAVAKQNERLEKEIEENMPFGPRESFSLRKDKEPEKTGVGYKVFVLKDGKLYPPMVANPGGEATPIGVWLDADAAPVVGVTKTGRMQVKAGGKGTQGGSGKLAYRPGWHLGEIPYASQFNRINPETGKRELFPANFVWAEVEYANDVDYQEEAMSYGMSKNGKFNHSLAGLPKVPKDGAYMYRTNPDPKTDPWIITGAMRVNRVLTPSEVDEMVIKAGREPQARQYGAVTDEQVNEINGNSTLTSQGKGVGSDGLKNSIQGLDVYSDDDVLSSVRSDIEAKLSESGLDGVTIKGMALHGSRKRGDAREDSDLDVVVEYEGDISEDGLFNILNEEPLAIEGIRIDINPIKKGKSGTLDEYMRRSREYDALRVAEKAVNTEPTDAQKEAGNYKKGHVRIGGFDISIEQPKGSVRSGVDADGKPWSVTMNNTYGYIRGTEGVDGDHIDVFLSDHIDDWNGTVYVVDQVDKDGNFDEHKVMYGFNSLDEAREAYMSNYSKDWQGLGTITGVSKDGFRKWVDSSHRKTKAFADYKNVSPTPLPTSPEGEEKEIPEKVTTSIRGDVSDVSDDVRRVVAHFPMETPEESASFDKRVGKMSDAELLAYMEADGNGDVSKAHHPSVYDEYDYRHGDELADAYDRYLQSLHDSNTTLEQAEEMLGNLRKDLARLATDERAELLGQEEALQEYVEELEISPDPSLPGGEGVDGKGDLRPVGHGVFGDIYDQFKGKPKEAVDFLLKKKSGDLLGVFHRDGFGDIDLVWGDKGGGAEHILDKHVGKGKSFSTQEDAFVEIDRIIKNGKKDFENGDKVVFKDGNKIVTVRKNWREKGKKIADKNWVLTAYDETSADSESPIATNKSLAGSATGVSVGKDRDLFGNEQEKTEKSGVAGRIDDVGERLEGARKDMRKAIALSLGNITESALIEKPFGKVYKKPDLKKAVESGALREKDAIFYDAFLSLVNQQKPKVTQSEVRMKKYRPDYKTKAEQWAALTHKAIDTLRQFVEADEVQRDALMDEILRDRYPNREMELAKIEERKRWNPDREGRKYEWGDKTTPNPLWVTYEVLNKLGYNVGDKVDIPYGVVKANTSGTGYVIENLKGERSYVFGSNMSIDDAIDAIVYLSRLKRGDSDISHPTQLFTFPATKSEFGETGRYRVMWGSWLNHHYKEFDSKEDADAFASTKTGAVVSPIREVTRTYGYKVRFSHPLTGEKYLVDDAEFDSKDEAKAYFDGNYDKVNESVNAKLEDERNKKGEKKTLAADDVVHVQLSHSKEGGWKYGVLIDKKYANNDGQPYIIRDGFNNRQEAMAFADSVKDDVLKTVLKHREDKKKVVYFDTGKNTRIGEDYRDGKDVNAEDFMNTFGFRGVQFGNWTNQTDRQMAVNQAYDAFLDMARLIGVSPKAMSLNGELGVAFGARGFAAHYEPDEVVINLTKTQGAGSLAHEWWHALDNYFARMAGSPADMVTDNSRIAMRDELRRAFDEMTAQVYKSYYAARSRSKGEYWGRMHEVTARLLAEWADQELKKRGELNTFLSRGANVETEQRINYIIYSVLERMAEREPMSFNDYKETPESLRGIPYPSAKEVEQFGDAMRNIFDVMEEKIDEETGNVALFSFDRGRRNSEEAQTRFSFDTKDVAKMDKDYMDAVEKGDSKSTVSMLRKAAKAAMPDTKVVNENGEPLVVYHGTNDNFTIFNRELLGLNTDKNASDENYAKTAHIGFWFTSEGKGTMSTISRKMMPCYLDLKVPMRFASLESLADELSNYDTAENFVENMKGRGYDGVILDRDEEMGGKSYAVFGPNQIKSAEPVTYDDNGKVIPLSERFNEKKDDIRFSFANERDNVDGLSFEQFSIVRRPTNNQRKEAKEKRMEERRREQAKAAALDAGIREPSREQYEARAHREWVQAHRAWEQAPDASAEPNEWDFEVKAQKEFNEARKRYEEKLQEYMPKRSDELTAADVIEERERMVHTPAQRMTNKIVDVMATERDPLSARDEVKGAVIQRRKNIEEISADDSIYINDIRRESDKLAMKLSGLKEKEDQVTALIRGIRKRMGVDKDMITGKDIREALPFLIEAEMRRREIVDEANMKLQGMQSPARLSVKDIKAAEGDINAMRVDADKLLAVQRQMEEEGRITMSAEERALRDKVYQQAHRVAVAMQGGISREKSGEKVISSKGPDNLLTLHIAPVVSTKAKNITADDIMSILSIVTKRVMPDGLKLMEYKDSEAWGEVQSLIGSIKDWYAVAYGWLEDAGLRREGVGYYEDYVNHVWDRKQSDPEAWERYVANRQPTTSKNMRKREIRTLMDGMELGLVPKYDDIADLMGDYSKSNILAWANKKMLRDLSFIDIVERGEDGEVKAMVPMLSTKAPNAFEIGKYDYYEIPGVGSLWVHKAVSKNFGLVFESYQPGKMMGTYDKFASIAKNIELAWSGFHAAALSEVYLAQNVMRHPVKMARNFWRYMVKDALLQGQPPAYTDPELYEDAARHLVKLGATGDYAPEALKDLSSSIKDSLTRVRRELQSRGAMGKAAGAVVGIPEVVTAAIKMVNNGMDKALWTWLHDGLKLCQYKMFREDVLSQAEREGWADERIDKALDEAGQYINDEFGGQHFEVISVSPKMLRMMRRFLLSPDWLLSTQRHFLANFGFGSIYNKANMRSFMDFYKNVWKRGKGNEGQFDGRYSRAKASIVCYGLGCMIMYPLMMNALNALMRKKDEEYELQKEKENEGYVSKYRLAYPDGMKGFEVDNLSLDPFESFNIFGDYGMGGNAEGKKSHLFFGRYSDDTEMYIRWGKQFREFPELFENEKGEAAFPSPLLKRLMGKSNPNIRFLYDTLNYYTRWDKSKNDEDLEDKWREWIGDGKLQRNFGIPMGVGAEKLLMNYLPFWAPTQRDKEWKPTDMILPSTKGFTAYKARNYFTQFIKVNDEEGIKETFKAAVLNGMNTAAITRAWESARKAVENESRGMRLKNGNEIQSVVEAFDSSRDLQERKELNSRIRKVLAADAEPPQDWDEFLTQVRAERDGDTEGATKASEKYLMVATSEDILEDARLAQLKKKASEMKRIHDSMKDNKADADLIRRWEQENQKWLDVQKIINDGESGRAGRAPT